MTELWLSRRHDVPSGVLVHGALCAMHGWTCAMPCLMHLARVQCRYLPAVYMYDPMSFCA